MGPGSYQRESEELPEVHLRLNRGFPMTIKRPTVTHSGNNESNSRVMQGFFFFFVFNSEHGLSAFHQAHEEDYEDINSALISGDKVA